MRNAHDLVRFTRPSLPLLLLLALLSSLLIAGGASRGDVFGQVVVRTVAVLVMVVAILFAPAPGWRNYRAVLLLLAASATLLIVQLIPLPPSLWESLPGRTLFIEATAASNQAQPWRPLAIVPETAKNALASLLVPASVLLLLMQLSEEDRRWLPGGVLVMIAISTLAGLLQFSGMGSDNPLVNDSPGQVSGTFANRNHFALFVAFGCMLAPVWAFMSERRPGWRAPVALTLMLLFALTILATGSRAGLIFGLIGLAAGLLLSQRGLKRMMRHYPKWAFPALMAGIVAVVMIFVLISIAADRAVSIQRVLVVDQAQDMRTRGLPTVLQMINTYFPAGTGFGAFDPMFRIHEPFQLLKLTYFNHAHNDWLEIVLDGGLPGAVLLAGAVLWWLWRSAKLWAEGAAPSLALARLGSAMLLLVMIASIFDYPARTPTIMALIVIAATWLSSATTARAEAALPESGHHL